MNNLNVERDGYIKVLGPEYSIQLWRDLEGLMKDERFQRLILQDFFVESLQQRVCVLRSINDRDSETARRTAMEDITGRSVLDNYFVSIQHFGQSALQAEYEDLEDEALEGE